MDLKQMFLTPIIIFVFINVWLLELLKKFNMDIMTKIVSYQIRQKTFNFNSTLVGVCRAIFERKEVELYFIHWKYS